MIDIGTPELSRRKKIVPIKMRTSVLVRVVDATAVDRALMRDLIDPTQHSVIVAFGNDCYRANLIGPRASDYGRPIGTGSRHETSQSEADALLRVGDAIKWLVRRVGDRSMRIVHRMVLDDRDTRSAAALRAAADSLIEFYGVSRSLRHRR